MTIKCLRLVACVLTIAVLTNELSALHSSMLHDNASRSEETSLSEVIVHDNTSGTALHQLKKETNEKKTKGKGTNAWPHMGALFRRRRTGRRRWKGTRRRRKGIRRRRKAIQGRRRRVIRRRRRLIRPPAKKPKIRDPLFCPSGTIKLGTKNAVIRGCGLTRCDRRYGATTILDCMKKCTANPRCNSFCWSPVGGDKNHLQKAVCTLHSRTSANGFWGPSVITCTIEQLQCPVHSIKVGGKYASFRSHGLTSRYGAQTIKNCRDRCMNNFKCKAFVWAPVGGDKSAPSKTTCALLPATVPDTTSGPRLIACLIVQPACPAGTVRVGGDHAAVKGHGLATTHDTPDIDACRLKCTRNIKCNMFYWAPVGGDKSQKRTTVCGLHATTKPNTKWGPRVILCKIPPLECPANTYRVGGPDAAVRGCGLGCSYDCHDMSCCHSKCKANSLCKMFFWAPLGGDKIKKTKAVCALYTVTTSNVKYGIRTILCRIPPMRCPASSIQVGGHGAAMKGCGLGCSYNVPGVSMCYEKCMSNSACKMFYWADVGGDRNRIDSSVCALYSTTTPDNTWGPRVILCRIPPLKCPANTIQVGGINARIKGCGIGGCKGRYDTNSIHDCLDKCIKTTPCRTFSWAPRDGDKDYKGKTVCSLYTQTIADGIHGPHMISCQIPGPPLKCPAKTVQVGGKNAAVKGCGLGKCSSRYGVKTIEMCRQKCFQNKLCRTFSWSPHGGDKGKPGNSVCGLYAGTTADKKTHPQSIVCEIQRPALSCPGGTVQVGGKNAAMNSCGLTTCRGIHKAKTIGECHKSCTANPSCNSFYWAPIGGDKSHMNKTVCALFGTDKPDKVWGPRCIMCKVQIPPLKCPDKTVQIGGINAGLKGCGLEKCKDRKPTRDIEACRDECASIFACKAFTWAPLAKAQCNIYGEDKPNVIFPSHQIMCKSEDKSLLCPPGSIQVGGQNAGVKGCGGVVDCEDRFKPKTMLDCFDACKHALVKGCKAFTWAPRGGDKRNADKSVCILSNESVPTTKLGPIQVMCSMTIAHQVLECPSGTIQVGGRNAAGKGCGLTKCSDRYKARTMLDCRAACANQRHCKAFVWSPIGGDKSHPNTTVCTLQPSARPSGRVRPAAIMCARDIGPECPQSPGCWVLFPDGCVGHNIGANAWIRATNATTGGSSGASGKSICMQNQQSYNRWCRVRNAEMCYNPPFAQTPINGPDIEMFWGGCLKKSDAWCKTENKPITQLMKSPNCDASSCIAAVKHADFLHPHSKCERVSIMGQLSTSDRWAMCRHGTFLAGLRRTKSTGLDGINDLWCCEQAIMPIWNMCYDDPQVKTAWQEDQPNNSWAGCTRPHTAIVGIYKGKCNGLHCIEKIKCCSCQNIVAVHTVHSVYSITSDPSSISSSKESNSVDRRTASSKIAAEQVTTRAPQGVAAQHAAKRSAKQLVKRRGGESVGAGEATSKEVETHAAGRSGKKIGKARVSKGALAKAVKDGTHQKLDDVDIEAKDHVALIKLWRARSDKDLWHASQEVQDDYRDPFSSGE